MSLKMAQLITSNAENLYELLGVHPSASIEEVRESYERKLEEVHEESLASYSLCPDEENEQRLKNLSMAFMKLADPRSRKQYDQGFESMRTRLDRSSSRSIKGMPKPEKTGARPLTEDRKVVFIQPQQLPDVDSFPSREESANESAKLHKDTFRVLAGKNEKTRQKVEEYVLSLEAHDEKVRFNGAILNQIRKLKGIKVSEMAEVTRIRQTYLNAIEEEKFEVFPSAVYLRGYLHCFIKTLDLPQEKVIRDYMKIYENWIRL